MQLKDFFKQLSISLCSYMIATTLVMLPFPSRVRADEAPTSTSTMMGIHNDANSKPDCQKDALNDDGSAGVYKPGCEFNEALTKLNETPKNFSVEGILEQFVMYAFAVTAVQSLIFTNTDRSRADCPANINAQITLRLMQVASILYILGEMKAKSKMKEAQELIVKTTFTPQAKQDETVKGEMPDGTSIAEEARKANQRQYDAFLALMKVYDLKIEGLQTKIRLASAAEVGYLGALATELLMVQAEKRTCDTAYETNKNNFLSMTTNIAKIVGTATTCISPMVTATSLQTTYSSNNAIQIGLAAEKAASTTAKAIKDEINIMKDLAAILEIPLKRESSVAQMILGDKYSDLDLYLASEKGIAIADDSSATTNQATETSAWTSTAAACSTAISQCNPATAVAGVCEACVACATQANLSMPIDLAAKQVPIMCCGADTLKGANGYSIVPYPSIMDKKFDINIKKIPIIGSHKIDLIKPAILNVMEEIYFARNPINLKVRTSFEELARLKKFYKQLENLDINFEREMQKNENLHSFEMKLALETEGIDNLNVFVEKMKNLLISEAHAGSTFSEILGFGSKLMLMSKVFGKFLRNRGLPKPKSRMITFGAMAAVDAAMIIWQNSKVNSNRKEKELIQHEAQRFANSHAIKTELDGEDTDGNGNDPNNGANPDPYIDTTGDMACATPTSGGGFSPAACPQTLPTGAVKIPTINSTQSGGVPPVLSQLPSLMTNAVNAAASGMETTNPSTYSGNLTAVNSKRNALKTLVDKLATDYDKTQDKFDSSKLKEKPLSLRSALATIQSKYSGSPANGEGILQDSGGALAASNDSDKEKKDASGANKVNPNVAAVPSFDLPKTNNSFDFDLGEDGGTETNGASGEDENAKAQDLAEFQLNENDIIDNADVSIFNVISNRYLRSYPVLLEEKKSSELSP